MRSCWKKIASTMKRPTLCGALSFTNPFTAAGIGLFICTCTIRSSRDDTATPLDWVGAILIGSAVAIFVFGVVEAPVRGWTHPVVWGCMAAGVVLAVAFAVVELWRSTRGSLGAG